MHTTSVVTKSAKNPDLDTLVSFLDAFQKMFETTSEQYGQKLTITDDPTLEASLKQVVPIVFTVVSTVISVFSNSLQESKAPEGLLATIIAAGKGVATYDAIGKIIRGALAKTAVDGKMIGNMLEYDKILKAFGIENISAITTALSNIDGIPALLAAIQSIEIKDDATSENIKAFIKTIKEQLTTLFADESFKDLEKLIAPIIKPLIASYIGNTAGGIAASIVSGILKAAPKWICESIILPRVLGLTDTGIKAESYTDLIGKLMLYVVDKLEDRIAVEEKRRLFEKRMKNADTALEELESGIQKCKEAISQKPDATEEVRSFSALVEKTKTDISSSLTLQQTELEQAKIELEMLLQKIEEIESSPAPSIPQLKSLLESTPKTHLDSLPADVVERFRKYIMDEEAKTGVVGHVKTGMANAVAVVQYLTSWWPVAKIPEQPSGEVTVQIQEPKQTDIKELLVQLKIPAEEKLETTNAAIEKNTAVLAKLEEVASETKKLKKAADRRQKLSSLDDLDAKISNIRTRLESYSKSYVRLFFGYLLKTKTYREYRDIKEKLGTILVAKEKFEQEISGRLDQKDMDAKLKGFEQQKEGLHTDVDSLHAQKWRHAQSKALATPEPAEEKDTEVPKL